MKLMIKMKTQILEIQLKKTEMQSHNREIEILFLEILFLIIISLINKFLQIQIRFFNKNNLRLIEKLEFKIALTNKMLEDIHPKYLVFNKTFRIIKIQKQQTAAQLPKLRLCSVRTYRSSCSLTGLSKIILFYLKLLQRKGTLKNFWLINLKFLKTNIIQMKIHLICKTDSRN